MSAPEFDGQPMTKREVLIARSAFVRGSTFMNTAWQETQRVEYCTGWDEIAASRAAYPLPKVKRPRVVADPHSWLVERPSGAKVAVYWKVCGSGAPVHPCDHEGAKLLAPTPTATPTRERVALWADLLANPTEEVDE